MERDEGEEQNEAGWTRRGLLEVGVETLEAAGIEAARRNVEWLLQEVLGTGRALLYAYPEAEVGPVQARAFHALLARRRRHEPLQYILGYTEFFGLRLRVSPAVLIPRPETEEVVEAALGLLPPAGTPRVLDVGTGSGCIALALQHARPAAEVHACDVSAAALAVAGANAEALTLPVRLFQADALRPDFPALAPAGLDLVVSNPPYIADREAPSLAPEVQGHEPHLALFAGEDPLRFYRALVGHARRLLVRGGHVVFETHADHAEEVGALLAGQRFEEVSLRRDLAGRPRIVWGRA